MKNIMIVFLLIFMQSSCSWGFINVKGIENKLADKMNLGKEESNISGEINKSKDEINSDKIETVNKTINDNSELGTIKANANIKTDINTKVKTNFSANAKVKGAVIDNSKENTQSAQNIENKEGLIGFDILYMLGGIALILGVTGCVICLIIGKFFMRSKNEKILETKYEEKHLLMSSINQYLFFGTEEEKRTAQNIINDYSNKQLMFGYK